uniref:Ovule protein n=1 Tax=Heterorhabditis bacteriophora TaxID=37862 RepID=A0A1I7X7G3_HETBA
MWAYLLPVSRQDSKGKELKGGSWSCSSSVDFLDHLFTMLKGSLPRLNRVIPTVFYPSSDPICVSQFSDVFQVSGLLGDYLKEKRTTTSICRFMKCAD